MEIFLLTTVGLTICTIYYKNQYDETYKMWLEYSLLHDEASDVIRETLKKEHLKNIEDGEMKYVGDIAKDKSLWITNIEMKEPYNSDHLGYVIYQKDKENDDLIVPVESEYKKSGGR